MIRIASALLVLATAAQAQSFNIDVGINDATYPLPSAAFGGAAAQPGTWNAVVGVQATTPLVNLAGAATGVTIACVGTGSYNLTFNNVGTSGDDHNLMDDASDPTSAGATWTIAGLSAGNYVLYTYAWAPDSTAFISNVTVPGSSDPAQTVGGAWPSGYVQGVTHAVHHIVVAGGGSVGMNITVSMSFATLNGFQLVKEGSTVGTVFCEPGLAGVMACPCANAPSGAGRGCDNSSTTGGASMSGAGAASLGGDTVVFTTINEKPTATSIVLQGDATLPTGAGFGQGVRCVGGTLKRLYTKTAVGGSITAPAGGDASVSAQSAALGDSISAGQQRWYMVYYRDPIVLGGCPPTNTWNATHGLAVLWNP